MKTSCRIFTILCAVLLGGFIPAFAGEDDASEPFEAWKDSGEPHGEYWVPPENEPVTYPKYERWGVITAEKEDDDDEETVSKAVAPQPTDPTHCPLWHNRPKARTWAKYHRKHHFMGLKRYPGEVMILHRHDDWKAPIRIGGEIRLKRIVTDGDSPYAVLSIGKGMLCAAEEIKVEVDDQPTPGTVILAIEPDFVLVEHQSSLGVWLAHEAKMPAWRMVWDTGVEIELEDEVGPASKTTFKKKSKKKVKGQKKRAKTRAKKK